ncbi:flagellin [Pelagibius litoralis]|uniref:Flagellin n=1 Tax=Pelagibius litoralis TaxID=374515 RepID=A0A967EXY8_9PROT|nr:flagellin [Pelagibius litoralis]NIA69471.1 flagellin [Pelagibius litoralis]
MPVVATNTAANSALRYLNNNSAQASASVGKLASGSRIVKASDDAAGLAIGTRLMADVTALTQAGINASQGASVVQVADGGLGRIGDVLQRMKALAAQSLSGVPTDTERAFIDAEFLQLESEITDIAGTTRFNGASLLDGGAAATTTANYFVGTDVSDTISVRFADLAAAVSGFTATAIFTTAAITVASATGAAAAMTLIDNAIDMVSEARATAGALISRFEFRGQQIATSLENIDAAKSAIMDVDLAAEQSKLVSSQVLVQAAVSAVSQANQIPQSLLRVLQ